MSIPHGSFRVVPAVGERLSDREIRVTLALERFGIVSFLPPFRPSREKGAELRVQLGREFAAGSTLEAAHAEWTARGLEGARTPEGLPRRKLHERAPRPVQQVGVERVDALTGGMSSHYGFRGYYLSLLLWLAKDGSAVIWDARGEPAT